MKTRLPFAAISAALFGFVALAPLPAAPGDHGPAAVSQPAPVYPFCQNQDEIEGAVLVHYHVNLQGDAVNAVVLKSTDPVFETAVLHAVRHWKFTPAVKNGQPVDTPVLQVVTFTVATHSPETPTTALVAKLQPRTTAVELSAPSTDLCYCGSNKLFVNCHRERVVGNDP